MIPTTANEASVTTAADTPGLSRLVRRMHMYTGLFLAPWMVMYALSTLVMAHHEYWSSFYGSKGPVLVKERELDYSRPFPANLTREVIAQQILSDVGMEGAHSGQRRQKRKSARHSETACAATVAPDLRCVEEQNHHRAGRVPRCDDVGTAASPARVRSPACAGRRVGVHRGCGGGDHGLLRAVPIPLIDRALAHRQNASYKFVQLAARNRVTGSGHSAAPSRLVPGRLATGPWCFRWSSRRSEHLRAVQ